MIYFSSKLSESVNLYIYTYYIRSSLRCYLMYVCRCCMCVCFALCNMYSTYIIVCVIDWCNIIVLCLVCYSVMLVVIMLFYCYSVTNVLLHILDYQLVIYYYQYLL